MGSKSIEVTVVVQQRRVVVFGDRGDQVIRRWDAEMLVSGAALGLEVGRAPFGAFGDPQERERCGIDRRREAWGLLTTRP